MSLGLKGAHAWSILVTAKLIIKPKKLTFGPKTSIS